MLCSWGLSGTEHVLLGSRWLRVLELMQTDLGLLKPSSRRPWPVAGVAKLVWTIRSNGSQSGTNHMGTLSRIHWILATNPLGDAPCPQVSLIIAHYLFVFPYRGACCYSFPLLQANPRWIHRDSTYYLNPPVRRLEMRTGVRIECPGLVIEKDYKTNSDYMPSLVAMPLLLVASCY